MAAGCSKAKRQARLVEGKVCFISDADNSVGSRWQRVVDICPEADSPSPSSDKQGVTAFVDRRRGRYMLKQHSHP